MPIGKNAIKRVENNGYSKVETTAPDMENSTVITNLDAQVEEKIIAPIEKKTRQKKTVTKKTEEKAETVAVETPVETKAEEKPVEEKAPVKKRKTAKKSPANQGFARVEVGEKMPYYLL